MNKRQGNVVLVAIKSRVESSSFVQLCRIKGMTLKRGFSLTLAVLVIVLPQAPLFILAQQHWDDFKSRENILEQEILGGSYIKVFFDGVKAYENGPPSQVVSHLLIEKIRQIKSDLIEKNKLGSNYPVDDDEKKMIEGFNLESDRLANINNFMRLVNWIGDRSQIIVDSQRSTYHLGHLITEVYPRIFFYNEKLSHSQGIKLSESDALGLNDTFYDLIWESRMALAHSIFYLSDSYGDHSDLNHLLSRFDEISQRKTNFKEMVELYEKNEEEILDLTFKAFDSLMRKRLYNLRHRNFINFILTYLVSLFLLGLSLWIIYSLSRVRNAFNNRIMSQDQTIDRTARLISTGEVFASMAHDIATPFAVIEMTAERILNFSSKLCGDENLKLRIYATRILNMTNQTAGLIENMKTLLKDSNEVKITEIFASVILENIEAIVQPRLISDKVNLRIFENKIEQPIRSNQYAIIQILVNLLNNAMDALKEQNIREIELRVFLRQGCLVFQVKDNGPGIPAEIQSKIFESLFTTKSNNGGTGLGLSMSLKMAQKLGGELKLVDSSNQGTVFELALPQLRHEILEAS